MTLKVLLRARRARAASQPDPLVRQAALVPPSVRGAAMRLACAVSEAERLAARQQALENASPWAEEPRPRGRVR